MKKKMDCLGRGFLVLAGLCGAWVVSASDGTWTSEHGGVWSDAANWTDGVKPDAGAATWNALTPAGSSQEILLDESVSLTALTNETGCSVFFNSEPILGTTQRYGVVGPSSGTFKVKNGAYSPLRFAPEISGSCGFEFTGKSMFAFEGPQTFTGGIFLLQNGGGVCAFDARYAASTSAPLDDGLLAARTLTFDNGSVFRLYGRHLREGIDLLCRLTPQSPDLVLLPTNFTARAKVSGGQLASGAGLADGSFIRHVRYGVPETELVISLDRPVTVEAVTTQYVSFAAGAWTVKTAFDSVIVEKPSSHGTLMPCPVRSGDAIIEVRRLAGGGTLTVDSSVELNGTNGTCVLGDATAFTGRLRAKHTANVLFDDLPQVGEVPPVANPAVWMDASAADSVTVSDGRRVSVWRDVRGTGVVATPWKDATPPELVEAGLNGRRVIDFGDLGSHKALVWDREVSGVRAVFAVLGSQKSGGTFMGSKPGCTESYRRGFDALCGIANTKPEYVIRKENGIIGEYANGGRVAINGTYVDGPGGMTGGWDVYTCSLPQSAKQISAFALDGENDSSGDRFSGGQMLAEVLVYTNALTLAQCQAVEAYLMKKWFNRDGVGYGTSRIRNVDLIRDVDLVDSDGAPVLGHADEQGTVAVGTLTGEKSFAVKAGTTLKVGRIGGGMGVALGAASTLDLSDIRPPSATPVLDGAVLWIDAANTDGVVADANGNVKEVRNLVPNAPTPSLWPSPVPPVWTTNESGAAIFEFGARDNGCCLQAFTNFMAASVFLVWEQHANGCQPLGGLRSGYVNAAHPSSVAAGYRGGGDYMDFFRNGWGGFVTIRSGPAARSGRWFFDGEELAEAIQTAHPNDVPMLVSGVMPTWGGRVSAIGAYGYDGTTSEDSVKYTGGFRLSEMLIYDRPLSDGERRDVEAYLTRKWFPQRAPMGYAADDGTFRCGQMTLDGDATIHAPTGVVLMADALTGRGTLSLTGGAVLVAAEQGQDVSIAGGVCGVDVAPETLAVAAHPLLHIDASDASTVTRYAADNRLMTHIQDQSAAGRDLISCMGEEAWIPYYQEGLVNGLNVVDFGARVTWDGRWAGVRSLSLRERLTGIRTVFWMWRDHPTRGGGWLLGDDRSGGRPCDFMRGGFGLLDGNSPYFDADGASKNVLDGSLRRNGRNISPVDVPTGDWEVLSLVTAGACAADRIAADGAYTTDDVYDQSLTNLSHWAGLQLGELIIYDRVLTESERLATERHLMGKWLGRPFGMQNSTATIPGDTEVTPSVTGGNCYAYGLSDSGTITLKGVNLTVVADTADGTTIVHLTEGSRLTLLGDDYSGVTFILDTGTTLDLGGKTVLARQVRGSGRLVNGSLVGENLLGGTLIIVR